MPSLAAHAITIETDDGTGNPLSYTNTAIGCSSGTFYLITDRFGLDGGKTIAGDTSRTVWYEGILTRDSSAFSVSRSADFIEAGCIASASSFSFSIKNTGGFWSTLEANNVFLARCRVTYHYVTSSDGTTFTFNKLWTGIIEDQPFGEMVYNVRCIDNSKDLYGSIPIASVRPDTGREENIPIAVGRVSYSPLVASERRVEKIVLTKVDGVEYKIASGMFYTASGSSTTIKLISTGVTFSANDERLVGSFLTVISGGTTQAIRITANDATAPTQTGFVSYPLTLMMTTLTLIEAFDSAPTTWTYSSTADSVWYFEVSKYSSTMIASTKPINAIEDGFFGGEAVYAWDTDAEKYSDFSELVSIVSESSISGTGYPGLSLTTVSSDDSGNLHAYFGIVATDIRVSSLTTFTHDGGTGDLPYLHDRSRTNYVTFSATGLASGIFELDLTLPSSELLKDFDALYLLLDFDHRMVNSSNTATVYRQIYGQDIHGRTVNLKETLTAFTTGTLGTSYASYRSLPKEYYGESAVIAAFYDESEDFDITAVLDSLKKMQVYPKLKLRISVEWNGGVDTYSMRLMEVGLVGKKTVSATSGTLYTTLRGETFGTGWRSPDAPSTARKTSTDAIYKIGDALEHLIRNYDYSHRVWKAAYAYKVGDRVRSTVDNGFIYVCTVAGTSHASTEPTWPTTLTSTVTDNTATWKALDTLKIHCNSFDTLATQRTDWQVGRAITEKKNSVDYYKELSQRGFFILSTDSAGRAKVKAWRENTTALVAFSSSNILQGSLSGITLSSMRKAYNEFLIRYDWNPGLKDFNKQLGITRVDEPQFPGINELLNPGTSLGTFTIYPLYDWFTDNHNFVIITNSSHGLSTGDYVSVYGNADGCDIPPSAVSVTNSTTFRVIAHYVAVVSSTSGSLVRVTDARLKWNLFAPGFTNYPLASYLWGQAHQAYVITKAVQKLPQEMGDCKWYPDPYATDPAGNVIWTDYPVGDNHAAALYLQNLVEWSTWQKKQVSFEVSHATARVSVASEGVTRYLEEGDPISFTDAKLTNSVTLTGWVHEFTTIPGDGNKPDRIRIGVTLNPEEAQHGNLIIESGSQSDTITESGSRSDTYTES